MDFKKWIENQLSRIPKEIIAFCFNLYETIDDQVFDVQLVGSKEFSLENDDWPCHAAYSSGEDVYSFQANDWEDALNVFGDELSKYMQNCDNNNIIKRSHIAFGFVDGDLTYIG